MFMYLLHLHSEEKQLTGVNSDLPLHKVLSEGIGGKMNRAVIDSFVVMQNVNCVIQTRERMSIIFCLTFKQVIL